MGKTTSNDGYQTPDVPSEGGDSLLAKAETILKRAPDRTAAALGATVSREAQNVPVRRQYANEQDSREDFDKDENIVDLMAPNENQLLMMQSMDEAGFREFERGKPIEITNGDGTALIKFEGQIEYEKFMLEPVVIRIHSTRDKNEAKLVFVGVNGDVRWLERQKSYRLPRKFVERLAQAQEMLFATSENRDPTVDNAMTTVRNTAQSYEFSVLQDPNPVGRRWLRRMLKEGS